ncbi:uncharacterized protein LOC106090992 [Stomoxys calcitrans]|uniref:uncharacterized protein LOC106090992 n=1 Tax=Stomoxys calcitrans TaxID=35570 RepID=UPI0027E29C80|nr:uncharacterized protein LOC106090992 [Stomoxys calcitrans]XP_013112827.2 uncharacterized protein LOC106090992 [Stomoxys calcitrans]XP_059218171.1 uncharacterized protein LOC106090992 [Stomoxys calcitrans]
MNSNITTLCDVRDESAVNGSCEYKITSTIIGKADSKQLQTCQCYLKHKYEAVNDAGGRLHLLQQQGRAKEKEQVREEKDPCPYSNYIKQRQQHCCQLHSTFLRKNTKTSSNYCSLTPTSPPSAPPPPPPPPTLLSKHGIESASTSALSKRTFCTHADTYAAVPYKIILDNSNTCIFTISNKETTLTVDKTTSSRSLSRMTTTLTTNSEVVDATAEKLGVRKHHFKRKYVNRERVQQNANDCHHRDVKRFDWPKYSPHYITIWPWNILSIFHIKNDKFFHMFFILLITLAQYLGSTQGLLAAKSPAYGLDLASPIDSDITSDLSMQNYNSGSSSNSSNNNNNNISGSGVIGARSSSNSIKNNNNYSLTKTSLLSLEHEAESLGGIVGEKFPSSKSKSLSISSAGSGAYLDKLDNLERSLAAVLIKVAYGTTSTTKRSIPDNTFASSLTTIATPLLTTQRYHEKSRTPQLNVHHRNYELDLERDHALPTTAPNADILKSNSNPTYPNPNRHHNNDRDRHRHVINSTPLPSLPEVLKKSNGHTPTIPMFSGADIPSYSPPARSFFTPPLPPEYQHPFADKPTLRGTNNEGGIVPNTGSYINRRPIPPPSLMPGHERIPFRPPDLAGAPNGNVPQTNVANTAPHIPSSGSISTSVNPLASSNGRHVTDSDIKKISNNSTKVVNVESPPPDVKSENVLNTDIVQNPSSGSMFLDTSDNFRNSYNSKVRKEVLPSIRRILSGSNGRKGDIPEVLLKQVTTRPNYHQPPSSPVVINTYLNQNGETIAAPDPGIDSKQNINKIKNMKEIEGVDVAGDGEPQQTEITTKSVTGHMYAANSSTSTPSAAAIGGIKTNTVIVPTSRTVSTSNSNYSSSSTPTHRGGDDTSSTSSSTLAAASGLATSSLAWNIHVYLSVILFTILAVYSLYKMVTYNKLTHLFSQSYFLCIHIILITICSIRTFYLCYDAYNIHSSFHIFISEILLNLPATFLTISFAVLILFLSLKSLNHKNRYSALIRPLTVVVGCGVHVMLCITLHYVESYTLQNHQQQQKLLMKRQQQQLQSYVHHNFAQNQYSYLESMAFNSPLSAAAAGQTGNYHTLAAAGVAPLPPNPPRVLSLICQIIYIFVCFSLGLLYLYLYRILKRVLRNKSQNYIHGYQNLSYAIHITIATALLFVLLAALQIFGAISISSTRPMITQITAEIDWFQWGYQFSLRLIEIAIITLISWVTGLKTNTGSNTVNINLTNNEARIVGHVNDTNTMYNTNASMNPRRLKQNVHYSQYSHPNVTNFFLPYTSSSSQEQFDMDYPARI